MEHRVSVIGWEELPDLSLIGTRQELATLLRQTYPDLKPKTLSNWDGQIWPFLKVMQAGDLIALPMKTRSVIALGKVTGPYVYRSDLPVAARHARPVEWFKELPRDAFDQDILYSFGAFMTVCRIQRNRAEERVHALLAGKRTPAKPQIKPDQTEPAQESEEPELDLEQIARDQIRNHISRKFKGHDLTRLVASILEAQGYKTHVSPTGPDGGVDIIAGKGPLGFDSPKLAVQVKSGDPADVKVIRELQGVMKNFRAEHGLFVSWGGFKGSVPKEASQLFFEIRLWDADDFVEMVQMHYDDLPDTVQAELPLKRLWTLVPSEE